jgi:hypothetical protein
MKVKDLQFPRLFLRTEIDLDADEVTRLLDFDIELHLDGETDTVFVRENTIIYHNPSSVTRFLYKLLYHLLVPHADTIGRDKLALGLFYVVRDYAYADYDTEDYQIPPVLLSFDKFTPAFIVREIIEPLVGAIPGCPVLFMKCKFTDTCQIFLSKSKFERVYGSSQLRDSEFPLLLVNNSVHNTAARDAHLLAKYLEVGLDKQRADKIIKNILADKSGDNHVLQNLFLILKMLKGDPTYVTDFMEFLTSSVDFSSSEMNLTIERQRAAIRADNYLSKNLKIADDGKHTPQVFRQWSQWSLLMGLIEKQLSPMRGSMWPASELVKPHEEKLRALMKEKSTKKKSHLNFEEMLETARELYDHNAIEPGKLIEVVMKDQRAWKD